MSMQPFPPLPGGPAPAVHHGRGRRRPALVLFGVVLVVTGIVAGGILLARASSTVEDNAAGLGRAPAGCSTVLDFTATGTFLVFYERKGTAPRLPGGCRGSGEAFDRASAQPPSQTLSLRGSDDREVTIRNGDGDGVSYDAGGFVGAEIGKVQIDAPGRYTLSVTPNDGADADYAVAIGKDPTRDESSYRAAGLGVLIAGVVLGGLLVILGLRRRGGAGAEMVTAGAPAPWNMTPPTWHAVPAPPTWPPQPPPHGASSPGFGSPPGFGWRPEPEPTSGFGSRPDLGPPPPPPTGPGDGSPSPFAPPRPPSD